MCSSTPKTVLHRNTEKVSVFKWELNVVFTKNTNLYNQNQHSVGVNYLTITVFESYGCDKAISRSQFTNN